MAIPASQPEVLPTRRDGVEEVLVEFVLRRLNQKFIDHAVVLLIAGIFAGDPHKLSIRHAIPKLLETEQKYGSLLKNSILAPSDRKESVEISRPDSKMFSFDDGLQVLPDALAAQLGRSVKTKLKSH